MSINMFEEDQDQLEHQNENFRNSMFSKSGCPLPFESIPGPKPLPIIGNVWRFMPFLGEFYNLPLLNMYKLLQQRYGNIVHFKGIFGRKPVVFIFDPEDMQILLRNEARKPIRYGLESYIYYRTHLGKGLIKGVGGILSEQGEHWHQFRTVVDPILTHFNSAMKYVDRVNEVTDQFIENMKYFSSANEDNEMPENFLGEIHKWALESIGVIALDKHLGCLNLHLDKDSDVQKLISYVIEMFELMYVLDILPSFWKVCSTPAWRRYVHILDYMTETIQKYIEEVLVEKEEIFDQHPSILQRLLEKNTAVALSMVTDMLIAGIDTTGRTLGSVLYFLARNPEKQERLREELLKYLPEKDSPVTRQVLANSVYLKAVIRETMRIAPISVGNLRTTTKDLVLSGYEVPKDTEVLCLHICSSNSSEFLNAEQFVPDRWLKTTADEYSYKNAHPFASMPFGFGHRSCVGKRIASLELEVGIAKIIRNFDLSWTHPDMVFSGMFLYGTAHPLKLKAVPLEK